MSPAKGLFFIFHFFLINALKLNLMTVPVTSPIVNVSPKRSTLSLKSQIPQKRFESVDCNASDTPRPIMPERVSEEINEVNPRLCRIHTVTKAAHVVTMPRSTSRILFLGNYDCFAIPEIALLIMMSNIKKETTTKIINLLR